MPPERTSIPALLARCARHTPDVQALVSDDASITWREVDESSRDLAARMVGGGLGKGDRVGLLLPNGIDWAVAAFAVMRVGGVLVPLSTLLRPPELRAQLAVAAVRHLVVAGQYRGRDYVDELRTVAPRAGSAGGDVAVPALRHVWTWPDLPEERVTSVMVDALEAAVRPADDMAVLFTSGSRGAPKGVLHTHAGALAATAAGLESRRVGPGERLYIPMPFFWTGGFCGGLLSVLVAGATLLTESAPDPAGTLRFLERERATLFRGWPDQAARIAADPGFAAADLSALGPASLPAVQRESARPRPGARANLFGMTESAGPYCGARLDLDLPSAKAGSCGRPFEGVEARAVDRETGDVVAPGEPGEIQIRGRNLMRGICGRTRSEVFGRDEFYATGDLGRIDEDGYLWFTGRADDMFKVKGATVYPTEVEVALRALPDVRQAFVTDVVSDDGRPEVGALVVSTSGPDALLAAVHGRLSAFKVPTRWLVVSDADAVPRMTTGKVDKAGLQELLASRGRPRSAT